MRKTNKTQIVEERSKNNPSVNTRELYGRIMEIMNESKPYLSSTFSISELTALVHSNRSYVSRAINEVTGLSFKAWISDYRNKIVLEELKVNPEASINELSVKSGHVSRVTFSRQFRKHNGMTLSEYRKVKIHDKR